MSERATRVAVLGAGPAGLGAALALSRSGVDVTVFERAEQVGGLCRSMELWGEPVELGAHLLVRDDPTIDRLWDELIGDDCDRVPRRTSVLVSRPALRLPVPSRRRGPTGRGGAARIDGARCGRGPGPPVEGGARGLRVLGGGTVRPARPSPPCSTGTRTSCSAWPPRDVDVGFAHSLVGAPRVGPAAVEVCRPRGGAGALLDAVAAEVERAGGSVRCGAEVARLAVDGGAGRGPRATRRRRRAVRSRRVDAAAAAAPRAAARRARGARADDWPRCAAAPSCSSTCGPAPRPGSRSSGCTCSAGGTGSGG